MTAPEQVRRTVRTRAFANDVGDQIAVHRQTKTIADVFGTVLRERGVTSDPSQVSGWADDVAALIVSDTRFDSETAMARRAVRTVLLQHFGDEISVFKAAEDEQRSWADGSPRMHLTPARSPAWPLWSSAMHLPILAAINPGPFEVPAGASQTPTIVLAVIAGLSLIVAIIAASIGSSNESQGRANSDGLTQVFFTAMAGIVLSSVALVVSAVIITGEDSDARDQAGATYAESTAAWLQDVYGVDMSTDSARELIDGGTLVVDYEGAETMIEIVDRADGDLSVRIPDGALLQPVSR